MPSRRRALWLAATVAVGCGATPRHERAKEALRRGDPDRAAELLGDRGAADSARQAGIGDALERAAESIGFDREDLRTVADEGNDKQGGTEGGLPSPTPRATSRASR